MDEVIEFTFELNKCEDFAIDLKRSFLTSISIVLFESIELPITKNITMEVSL